MSPGEAVEETLPITVLSVQPGTGLRQHHGSSMSARPSTGDHVVEHSGVEPAPHGLVVAQQLPNGVDLLGVAPAHGLFCAPEPSFSVPGSWACAGCELRPADASEP